MGFTLDKDDHILAESLGTWSILAYLPRSTLSMTIPPTTYFLLLKYIENFQV